MQSWGGAGVSTEGHPCGVRGWPSIQCPHWIAQGAPRTLAGLPSCAHPLLMTLRLFDGGALLSPTPEQESDSHQLTGQSRASSMPWGHLWEAGLQLWPLPPRKDLEAAALCFPASNGEPARTPFLLQPNRV